MNPPLNIRTYWRWKNPSDRYLKRHIYAYLHWKWANWFFYYYFSGWGLRVMYHSEFFLKIDTPPPWVFKIPKLKYGHFCYFFTPPPHQGHCPNLFLLFCNGSPKQTYWSKILGSLKKLSFTIYLLSFDAMLVLGHNLERHNPEDPQPGRTQPGKTQPGRPTTRRRINPEEI